MLDRCQIIQLVVCVKSRLTGGIYCPELAGIIRLVDAAQLPQRVSDAPAHLLGRIFDRDAGSDLISGGCQPVGCFDNSTVRRCDLPRPVCRIEGVIRSEFCLSGSIGICRFPSSAHFVVFHINKDVPDSVSTDCDLYVLLEKLGDL